MCMCGGGGGGGGGGTYESQLRVHGQGNEMRERGGKRAETACEKLLKQMAEERETGDFQDQLMLVQWPAIKCCALFMSELSLGDNKRNILD